MTRTAVVWDERYTRHDMGRYHVESPDRLWSIKQVLDGDGVGQDVRRIEPREATRDELAYIHEQSYIERIAATEGEELAYLDPDTMACADSWQAALLAAGGVMRAADLVCERDVKNAFAFVRPPGHHAERDHSLGFCLFNNIAIAAEHLIRRGAVQRIAIVDVDVHHGNGTQHAFYERDDVFFASIHRSNFFPGSGYTEETGSGAGAGTTLNMPLAVGAGDDDYKRLFDASIIPAVRAFEPHVILVSAGFDAHVRDPLGGMKVSTEGFRWIARTLAYMAKDFCNGTLMMVLEGGYDLTALRDGVEVMLEELVAC